MKKFTLLFIIAFSAVAVIFGKNYGRVTNASYKYSSSPGFVNITELTGAKGTGDTDIDGSKFYLGATTLFGYQIDNHFTGDVGVGFFKYDIGALMPLYMEFRYTGYLRPFNPYFSASGGALADYNDLNHGSKIFINPAVGLSRSISPKLDFTLGAGLMIQMGDNVYKTSFLNVKAGLMVRKNSARMYKTSRNLKGYCPY